MAMRKHLLSLATDIIIGFAAIAIIVLASRYEKASGAALIVAGVLVVTWAGIAGYRESSANWVWIHAPMTMSFALIAFPVALMTCRGFECAGVVTFLGAASLFTVFLLVSAFVGYFIRRRSFRTTNRQLS